MISLVAFKCLSLNIVPLYTQRSVISDRCKVTLETFNKYLGIFLEQTCHICSYYIDARLTFFMGRFAKLNIRGILPYMKNLSAGDPFGKSTRGYTTFWQHVAVCILQSCLVEFLHTDAYGFSTPMKCNNID